MTQSRLNADAAVDVYGLMKSYGDVHAVAGVDLRIETGEIFALLGANGTGKTTTVEILDGAYGIISACYSNIAISLTIQRDAGILKRTHGTPLPAPIVNASILPLLFLSGIFIPIGDDAPSWIVWVARIFPVKHFADCFSAGYLGTAFRWSDLLIVAAWGLGALIFARFRFTWEPRT